METSGIKIPKNKQTDWKVTCPKCIEIINSGMSGVCEKCKELKFPSDHYTDGIDYFENKQESTTAKSPVYYNKMTGSEITCPECIIIVNSGFSKHCKKCNKYIFVPDYVSDEQTIGGSIYSTEGITWGPEHFDYESKENDAKKHLKLKRKRRISTIKSFIVLSGIIWVPAMIYFTMAYFLNREMFYESLNIVLEIGGGLAIAAGGFFGLFIFFIIWFFFEWWLDKFQNKLMGKKYSDYDIL